MLTALPRCGHAHGRRVDIHSDSGHFETLVKFNPYYSVAAHSRYVGATMIANNLNAGSGHFIQQLERASGLPPEIKPRGCVVVENVRRIPGLTVLHLQTNSQYAAWQRKHIHPRARQVYPENMEVLRQFIRQSPQMHFVEMGGTFSELPGVENCARLPLEQLINRMAECEYFIGLNSGPMHLAAALGLKIVTIVTGPDPTLLYLPALKQIPLYELQWLYPQSVILHQDGEGALVARFSLENLERAIAGELYPYWSDDYLDLIFEPV